MFSQVAPCALRTVLFTCACSLLVVLSLRADPLPVPVEKAQWQDGYRVALEYAGRVRPARAAQLAFEIPGRIAGIAVDVGSPVRAGQILAELDCSSYEVERAIAESNHKNTQSVLRLATSDARRIAGLLEEEYASEQQEESTRIAVDLASGRMEEAQRRLERAKITEGDCRVLAPWDGLVQSRLLDEGQYVRPGESVLAIIQVTPLEVALELPPETFVGAGLEQSWQVSVNADKFPAQLLRIAPALDERTRSREVVLQIPDGAALIGQGVRVEKEVWRPESGFWVGTAALSRGSKGLWSLLVVYQNAEGDYLARTRIVEVLHKTGDRAYVRTEIMPDELIARGGARLAVAGQIVQPIQ